MPVMDGIEFLKRVRASGSTLPFIIFTGRGREEIVIQALNEGADFYLQKGGEPVSQFAELAHKIRQAVQQRRAEASIRDHERREADILNFLPDATFAIDTRGVVIAWNRAMEKMTGVSSQEILGKGDFAYAIPFYHERRPILINLVLTSDPDTVARYPYIKHEGKTLISEITIPHFNNGRGAALWFTASPLVDRQGTIVGAIESIREITDWKQAEEALNESERRFRELSDLLPQVVYETDMDGNLKYTNHIAFEIFGYTEDDFRQGLNVMQMIAPDDRERAMTGIRATCDGKGRTGRETAEYQALRKDGTTFPVAIYSSPVVVDDRITGLRGIIVDITERKRAEADMRSSRNLMQSIFDAVPDLLIVVDRQYRILYSNFKGHDLVKPEELEMCATCYGRFKLLSEPCEDCSARPVFENGEIVQKEMVNPADGRIRDVRAFPIFDASGNVSMVVEYVQDITERKRVEDTIRESEQKYRTVFETTGTATVLIENDRTISLANTEFERLSGFRKDEIENRMKWTDFVHEEDRDRMLAQHQLRRESRQNALSHYEFRFRSRSGEVRDIYLTIDVIPGTTKSVASLLDITERKQAENAIRESEQRYRNVVEDQTELISRFLPDGTHVFVNEAYCRYFGLKRDEILGHRFRPQIPAEDEEHVRAFFASLTPDHPVDIIVHRIMMPDGSTRWQRWSDRAIFDASGSVTEFQSVGRDVTESKETEIALMASEDRYRKLVEITPDTILVHQEGRIVYMNPAGLELLGAVHMDEVVGRPVFDFVHTESRQMVRSNIENDLKGEKTPHVELRMLRLDGTAVTIEGRGVQTLYQGKPAIQVAIRDITGRKETEDMIRLLSRKDREALRVARMGHFEFDVATQTFLFNDQYYAMVGMTAEEAGGYTIPAKDFAKRFVYPDDAHFVEDTIREAINTQDPDFQKQFESRIIRPDGTVLWVRVWFRIEKDARGNTIRFYGVNQDITDRKQAEQELVAAYQEYQNLLDQIQDVYYRSDTEGRLIRLSRSLTDLLGYRDVSELLGKNIAEEFYLNPDDRTKLLEEITRKGKVTNYEVQLRRKDGTPVTISASSHIWYHPDGTWGGVEGNFRDITDQKQAEDALRENELLLREIFNNANDAIFLLERNPAGPGKYLMVNDKAARMLGYSKEELLTMSPRDIVPEDIARKVMPAVIQKLLRDGHATFESAHRRKDGSIYPIEVSTHTFRYGGKDVDLSIVRDITERKRSERFIQETSKKISLLYGITRHDVANQVSILKGYTKLAMMKGPDPAVAGLLEKIDTAGSTIARQIEFAREYQELGMHAPGWHRIRDIIAQQKTEGISLSCTCDAEIFADPMIAEVFFNLFDNAVRHGERVTEIAVSCQPDPDGLVIVVSDNGVGVPPDLKDRIFEKGYGMHTGFGLFLAREILAITGIIIVETGTHGKGARFEIIVPKGMYRFME
jgi:PAS domain S-box-containing protein